jgi:predicted TIM-barrel fold metal-dependent hydrolase
VRLAHKALLDHLLFHALEVAAQQELPFHLHTGFGDRDLWLPQTDPTLLRHVLEDERYRSVPFVLLHCYPFLRQGAYLAHVYPNVYIDLSLGVPLVGFGVERVYAEALELAPTSKVLYGSDAFSAPDLMLLGAVWARAALGAILERWVAHGLAPAPAERLAEAILHGNTLRLHGLAPGG